jgi:hypothetical protein
MVIRNEMKIRKQKLSEMENFDFFNGLKTEIPELPSTFI